MRDARVSQMATAKREGSTVTTQRFHVMQRPKEPFLLQLLVLPLCRRCVMQRSCPEFFDFEVGIVP
jgi:hypothetical protein